MIRTLALVAALAVPGLAAAHDVPAPPAGEPRLPAGEALVMAAENDSFDLFDNRPYSDRYYTHGTHFSVLTDSHPAWVERLGGRVFPAGHDIRASMSMVQNIYTPREIEEDELLPEDRPYAGLFYIAGAVIGASETRLRTLEARVGFVGPSSMGGLAQDTRHDAIEIAKAQGWDHEIRDEFNASLAYEARAAPRVISSSTRSVLPRLERSYYYGGELGTFRTALGAGGAFAAHWGADRDYGPMRSWPAPTTGAFVRASPRLVDLSVFVGADLQTVFRDVTLDGNLTKDSPRVDKRLVAGELQGGVSLRVWIFRLGWARVIETPEFEEQARSGDFHEFERWSLSLVPFGSSR